jgi:putative aldouronate transport system substrate-binding protein
MRNHDKEVLTMYVKFKSFYFAPLLIVIFFCLSACSPTRDTTIETTDSNLQQDEAYQKNEESITVETMFIVDKTIADVFTQMDLYQSAWNKGYEDELGITLNYAWIAMGNDDNYHRVNVALTSGDIPDIMVVSKEQLPLLAQSDLINKNLKSIYDQYATPLTYDVQHGGGNMAFDSATFNGQLIAIPNTDASIDTASFLFIRRDWLEKLELEVPTTLDDLYQVMKAFKENDPDGNGIDDTYGLMLTKNFLTEGVAEAIGIFNGFHAYPTAWVQDKNGTLVYGSTLPEVKEALTYLNRLYTEGLIDPEFAAKTPNATVELSNNNKVGVQYGKMWNPIWPLQTTLDNHPEANWQAFKLLSNDHKTPQTLIGLKVRNYFVVRKDFEHPEALIKLINFFTEKQNTLNETEYEQYFVHEAPVAGLHMTNFQTWPTLKNLEAHWRVVEALETRDTSQLNIEEMNYYNDIISYKNGDNSCAKIEKVFGTTGSYAVMDYYYQNNSFKFNEFHGAPTDAMKIKMERIFETELDFYTRVIMGQLSVDDFDEFVLSLNHLGLNEITEEVNQWYDNKME